eukprot:Seg1249.12 transcript_id=Seg1249.12/GoldUCD/mRNA.D3Y31 product="Polycystic kidney disease protein 1-like 2" protein_id=Seg1249.12/GoldUCD/D3Y31
MITPKIDSDTLPDLRHDRDITYKPVHDKHLSDHQSNRQSLFSWKLLNKYSNRSAGVISIKRRSTEPEGLQLNATLGFDNDNPKPISACPPGQIVAFVLPLIRLRTFTVHFTPVDGPYSYQWSHNRSIAVATFSSDNMATFIPLLATPAYIGVTYFRSSPYCVGRGGISVLIHEPFGNYSVNITSKEQFLTNTAVDIRIMSTGMDRYHVYYRILCDGMRLTSVRRQSPSATRYSRSFTAAGPHYCQVRAYVLGSSVLEQATAPGTGLTIKKSFNMRNVMTIFEYSLIENAVILASSRNPCNCEKILPASTTIAFAFYTDGFGTTFTLMVYPYQDNDARSTAKKYFKLGSWNNRIKLYQALIIYDSKRLNSSTIELQADNVVSKKVGKIRAQFRERITPFNIQVSYYQKIGTQVEFRLTSHKGTFITYYWAIDAEGSSFSWQKNTQTPVLFHTFNEAFGNGTIMAFASNNLSSYRTTKSIYVYHELRGLQARLSPNSSVICVPMAIQIEGIAKGGNDVFCNITSGSRTLYHGIARPRASGGEAIACKTTVNLSSIGFYNFIITMYNSMNMTQIVPSIEGIKSDSLKVNMTSATSLVETDAVFMAKVDSPCPLLRCNFDFGDGANGTFQYMINGSTVRHRYTKVGHYKVTGSCFRNHLQVKFETRAAVSDLIVKVAESKDNCFPSHQLYVLNIAFKYATMKKSWKVKLDGYYFADPSTVLTEQGLKATLKMDPMYHFAGTGDFKLEISVSDGILETIIKRDICVRFVNKKVKMSVEQASTPGRQLTFVLMTTDSSSLGMCHIQFGDGRKHSTPTNINQQVYVINSSYAHVGVYRYTWSVRNSTTSNPDITGQTTFYLLLQDFGIGTEFIWDFKDRTVDKEKVIKFSAASSLPGISSIRGTESLNLTKYMGYVRQHTYTSKGMYDVSITANDQFTTLVAKRTVFVSNKVCKRPDVKILPKDQKLLQFSLGETFTILSDVKLECDDFDKAVFEWRIYASSKEAMNNDRVAESDKTTSFPLSAITDQREITLQKYSLSPGFYIVQLNIVLQTLGYSDFNQKYLKIIPVPLYVRIKGDAARLLSWERDILLDGSLSYDPNILSGNQKNLQCKGCGGYISYKWKLMAQGKNGTTPVPIRWMVDTRTPENSISLVLLPEMLERAPRFIARFVTTTPIGEQGYTDFSFRVSEPPYGGFCNVTPAVGESMKTTFHVSCHDWKGQSKAFGYSISLIEQSIVAGSLKNSPEVTILSYGSVPYTSLNLPEGPAMFNYTQRLMVRIIDSYGASTQTNVTVQVYPYEINKENETNLSIEAELEKYVSGANSTLAKLIGSGDVQGLGRFTKAIGRALDSAKKKSSTTSITKSEKMTRGVKRKTMRKSIIDSLTNFKVTNLDNFALISSALQEVSAAEDEINEDSQLELKERMWRRSNGIRFDTERNGHRRGEEQRKISKPNELYPSQMKKQSSPNYEMEKMKDSFPQSSDKLLKFYGNSSAFIEQTFSNWGDRDPNVIQNAFGRFLGGIGNLLESAVTSRVQNATKRAKSGLLNFTKDTLQLIENSTAMVSRSMVANEIAKRYDSESISIEVKKSEGSRLNSVQMETLGGGIIQTPSGSGVFGGKGTNSTSAVDMRMVTLLRNPYAWGKSGIGKVLTPTVSSLKYTYNNNEMKVNNLPSHDQLVVQIPTPKTELVTKTFTITKDKLLWVKIELPANGLSVMLRPRCYGSSCRLFVRYDGVSTIRNDLDSFDIGDSSHDNNSREFRTFPSINGNNFFLGISQTKSKGSAERNSTARVNFTMELFNTGCFYWKETENTWSADGCQISNKTNWKKTVCLCNHLSWFGAGILVKPNVLDIKESILKLKNLDDSPALLATVCVMAGLYIIGMVLARRQDKKDTLKTALIIVEDCCQSHKFRYDVTIYTGSRLGSGTTASICIIIGGSSGESEPHCLSHQAATVFQRDSVDSFLVTCKEDLGNIEAIRVWHDNTGKSPSWFVSRIIITNILKGTQTNFLCHSWLGIGMSDGKIDRIFLAAKEKDLKNFETLFLAKTSRGLTDDHLWFSVAMRPARSHFTRCQRLSCCFCVLLCTMLTNAMFYKRGLAVAGSQISIGSFKFSWRQLVIGIQSTFIVLPINVLIVHLFRKAAPAIKVSLAPAEEETTAEISVDKQGGKIHRKSVLLRPLFAFQSSNNPITSNISDHTMELVRLLNEPGTEKMPFVESAQKGNNAKQQRSVTHRKAPKAIPMKKSRGQGNSSLNVEDVMVNLDTQCPVHDDESIEKKKELTYWPHWCEYVAWTICFLVTVTAAFFTLLYGITFERSKQEAWLVSLFTSVLQDVFISQPIKVIIIGCVFALILKKLSSDATLPETELMKRKKWVKKYLPLQNDRTATSKTRIPLSPSLVEKAHNERLQEIKIQNLTLEIIVYFVYIFFALLIAYGHRSSGAYEMGSSIKSMIVTKKFDQVLLLFYYRLSARQ